MKYIIRLDDICPQMDWDKWYQISSILLKNNVKPVIGVIPLNKDKHINYPTKHSLDSFKRQLKYVTSKGFEIAQHGYTHQLTQNGGQLNLYPAGEFPDLPEAEQYSKITKGRAILEKWGFPIQYFYPPAHSYDETTKKVLAGLKFTALLDGIGFYPWRNKYGLIQVPQIWWRPTPLPLYADKLKGTIMICLHPNLMYDKDIDNLEKFVKKYPNKLTSLSKTIEEFHEIRPDEEAMNQAARLFYSVRNMTR